MTVSLPENAPTGYHAKLHDAIHESGEVSSSPNPYEPTPKPISEMTDSEKLDEIVLTMRTVAQALNAFSTSGAGQMMARMFTRK